MLLDWTDVTLIVVHHEYRFELLEQTEYMRKLRAGRSHPPSS